MSCPPDGSMTPHMGGLPWCLIKGALSLFLDSLSRDFFRIPGIHDGFWGGFGVHSKPMTDPWDERYIYLHEWLILMVNVGKYTIHGSYGKFELFELSVFVPCFCVSWAPCFGIRFSLSCGSRRGFFLLLLGVGGVLKTWVLSSKNPGLNPNERQFFGGVLSKKGCLPGGFKYHLFLYPYMGKWYNLTNNFQLGWFNHHLVVFFMDKICLDWQILDLRSRLCHFSTLRLHLWSGGDPVDVRCQYVSVSWSGSSNVSWLFQKYSEQDIQKPSWGLVFQAIFGGSKHLLSRWPWMSRDSEPVEVGSK